MNEGKTPWFRTWPPELEGGEVKMKPKIWWERWKITGIMLLVLLVGVVGLFACRLFLYEWEWRLVVESVFVAILIAGILGLSIDRFFRQQFAEDAFKASIGYLLPGELKGEMEWIYKCHIICIHHFQRFELLSIDDELCTVHVNVNRTLHNISGGVESVELGVGVDEWFHKKGSSRIVTVGYLKQGKRWTESKEGIHIDRKQTTINMKKRKVSLAPNEKIDTWYEIEEIKRTNDIQGWNFAYPTLNPVVVVKAYEGLGVKVDFGYRIPSEQLSNDTYKLPGTLLPGQSLSVQWWRIEDANKWLGEVGNSK